MSLVCDHFVVQNVDEENRPSNSCTLMAINGSNNRQMNSAVTRLNSGGQTIGLRITIDTNINCIEGKKLNETTTTWESTLSSPTIHIMKYQSRKMFVKHNRV